jgi:hypothetical protein
MLEIETSRPTVVDAPPASPTPEPTLGAALRSVASAQLPGRFYQGLLLAAPAASQFWVWGWKRSAGWMAVASAFGIWALCQQSLRRREEWAPVVGVDSKWRRIGLHVARRSAGFAAALLAGGLIAELFVHVMSAVFKCPGCAG